MQELNVNTKEQFCISLEAVIFIRVLKKKKNFQLKKNKINKNLASHIIILFKIGLCTGKNTM